MPLKLLAAAIETQAAAAEFPMLRLRWRWGAIVGASQVSLMTDEIAVAVQNMSLMS